MRKIILISFFALSSCTGSRVASRPVQTPPQPVTPSIDGDRVTVAFSDPSKPGLLQVNLLNGAISVRAYSGKEVIIEGLPRRRESTSPSTAGLHRLEAMSAGLRIEEQNNIMTVQTDSFQRAVRVDIQVPVRTNLKLQSVNGGSIDVEGVEGDMDIENTNGRVAAGNVAGSVTAHSLNGGVLVTMRQVTPGRPLSFGSQNGAVDVTLPPDIKANAKMRTDHGGIWTDFDIQMKQSEPAVRDSRAEGGRYRIDINRDLQGTINGGGPDLTLTTFNGSIYIRRAR